MSKKEDTIIKGNDAAQLLESRIYKEAMGELRRQIINRIAQSPIVGEASTIEQQKLIMLLQLSHKFESCIKQIVETGKLEAIEKL